MSSFTIRPHATSTCGAKAPSADDDIDRETTREVLIQVLREIDRKLDQLQEVVTGSAERENEVPASDLMDVKTVARRLNISVRKVESLIAEGQLRPLRIGRKRLFTAASIEAFLRASAGRTSRMRSRRTA